MGGVFGVLAFTEVDSILEIRLQLGAEWSSFPFWRLLLLRRHLAALLCHFLSAILSFILGQAVALAQWYCGYVSVLFPIVLSLCAMVSGASLCSYSLTWRCVGYLVYLACNGILFGKISNVACGFVEKIGSR